MNCKDLTIGSLVRDIDSKEVIEVGSLHYNRMYTNIKYNLDDIEGIPLSYDWLKNKFNLKEKYLVNESHFELFNGLIYIQDYGFICYKGITMITDIDYVHQFQNIYTIFNQELEISL